MFKIIYLLLLLLTNNLVYSKTKNGIDLTKFDKQVFWKFLPVRICPDTYMKKNFSKNIDIAINNWNKSVGQKIFENSCKGIRKNNLVFKKEKFSEISKKSSLARTIKEFDEDTGEILKADIYFNGEYFDWNKKIDFTTILVHELGHVFGLKHNHLSLDSVMNYYSYQSGIKMLLPSKFDAIIIKKKYFNRKLKLDSFWDDFFNGDYDQAIGKILKSKQEEVFRGYAVGFLYTQLKDYQNALPYLQDVENKVKLKEMVQNTIGEMYWSQGKSLEAFRYFKKAVSSNPDFYESHANMGPLFLNISDAVSSVKSFKKAIEINPNHYVSCFYLLKILKDKKYFDCVKKYSEDQEIIELANLELNKKCDWCIENSDNVKKEIQKISKMKPKEMFNYVKSKDIDVKVYSNTRKKIEKFFYWGKVVRPTLTQKQVTKINNLMGKTYCKGEHEVSKNKLTIVLAEDAPKTTLIHEYLHSFQIKNDKNWCQLSKKSWSSKLTELEHQDFLNKEWDVLKTLWKYRKSMKLGLEDKITISSELLGQLKGRKHFDFNALHFAQTEKIKEYSSEQISKYRKLLMSK